MEVKKIVFLNFKAEEKQRYIILRDYYIYNMKEKGILFVLKNEENGEIKTSFLSEEELNNEYIPKKAKRSSSVKYIASVVEQGEENSLIIEKGIWRKKNALQKIIEVPSKRYRYILKEK
jgi:hypothetical protein